MDIPAFVPDKTWIPDGHSLAFQLRVMFAGPEHRICIKYRGMSAAFRAAAPDRWQSRSISAVAQDEMISDDILWGLYSLYSSYEQQPPSHRL